MAHPTVEKYKLQTYCSRYSDQRDVLNDTPIAVGDEIANVQPILNVLQGLGLVRTKTFKYARIASLPLPASADEITAMRLEAERLVAMTDPEWPLDNRGCSVATYWPLKNWLSTDCHELGAQHAAEALRVHIGTQIDENSTVAMTIRTVAQRRWESGKVEPVAPTATHANGWINSERHTSAKDVFLHVSGSTLRIFINQWKNSSHEAIYRALKSLGAKWDANLKAWLLPLARVTLDTLETKLAIDRDQTKVVCTQAAWAALNRPVTTTETAPAVRTAVLKGRTTEIRKTRRPGEVLIDRNGQGLKLYMDAPWVTESHGTLKEELKRCGARWDPDAKCWRLGASVVLTQWGLFQDVALVVTEGALEILESAQSLQQLSGATEASTDAIKASIDAVLPDGKRLFPFQYAAVEFAERAGGRALLAEEMGLGKSVESLGYLALHPEQRPAILVVPAVVAGNWRRECQMWLPKERVQILKTGKTELAKDTTIFIITYDLLKKHLDALQKIKPVIVVGDECHLVKNHETARAKAFITLSQLPSVKSLLGLSGTPIVNRPLEFYTFLHLLRPDEFSSWKRFTERYCDGHYEQVSRSQTVWQCGGATNTDELNTRLRSLMIRRLKADVLSELPPKLYQTVPVEMTPAERKLYQVADGGAENALAAITAQRQVAGQIKVRAALEWIESHQEAGAPLLVFAHHKDVLDALEHGCQTLGVRYGRIDGSVSAERRTQLVEDFQADKLDTMLLSAKAAGVGITLTRASNVLFVECLWTPGDMAQAEDRAHRIGQRDTVTVRMLQLEGTIDDDMAELLANKREVLAAVLDGKLPPNTNLDIREELIARYEAQKAKK